MEKTLKLDMTHFLISEIILINFFKCLLNYFKNILKIKIMNLTVI